MSDTGYYITKLVPPLGSVLFDNTKQDNYNNGDYNLFDIKRDSLLNKTKYLRNIFETSPALDLTTTLPLLSNCLNKLNGKIITIIPDVLQENIIKAFNPQTKEFNGEEEYSKTFENIVDNQNIAITQAKIVAKENIDKHSTDKISEWDMGIKFYITSMTIVSLFIFYRLYKRAH